MSTTYHVAGPAGDRLVKARNRAQAIAFVARREYKAEPASVDVAHELALQGVRLESALNDPQMDIEEVAG